ncbi:ankyrin repeat domain-containing protein SOWAHB isoform X5 [Canis lupus familiaris]|uniref:Sosondowah ankyrin repeat domain family member B n=1 Tax=Canis lupus familiaris TaxID=9615 RepID=A0A8P0SDU1_CANLF|nr:ankyrin repeat domain-containing protein SOWAHB isoform X5 [Canis lupus familiaris]|eukprot:XP_544937.3 ankyrin repeat domain-containing protein SOWAHB [Canis lupus familiaris]
MARELSQAALLDFLCRAGGRVANAALLSHFRSFLRDPDAPPGQHQRRRELFKGFVNAVAAVRQDPDGTKYVVLKRRYRHLLGQGGLQRPRAPPAAAAPAGGAASGSGQGAGGGPQPPGAQRRGEEPEREPEREPAGAAAPAPHAARRGPAARGAREAPPGGGPGPRAAARCAAAETRGRCRDRLASSPQALPGKQGLGAAPDAATPGDEPGAAGRGPRGQPAAPRSPPARVEAVGGRAPPQALPSRAVSPGSAPEPLALGSLPHPTLRQRQPQTPRARDQGPVRAWSVLPDSFPRPPSERTCWVGTPTSEPADPTLPSHSALPAVPESCPENPPLTVFRSIRCQLSFQDLDDFVDQDSHGSEESSSGPKESPGGSEGGLQVALGTPGGRKLRNPAGGLSPKEGGLRDGGDGHASQQLSTEANGLAGHPRESLPRPAPKLRRSLRRSSPARIAKLSSSDEEYLEHDLLKRTRRPPRSRKPSKAGAVSSPRVDAVLIPKPADLKAAVAEWGWPYTSWAPAGAESTALVPQRPEHKSSVIPLDAREHEWIVKLASGCWIRVLTLFWEDPQLALHKDFLTGYTALHWIAKHGDLRALQDFVSSAQKAGIALDVNVKSSCGYTPLHLAAIHGHQGVIKLLVQRLASRVNVRDCSGKKPWQYLTSDTSGEIWQLLEAPRGRPIFPVYPLARSSSPTRKARSREISRNITRKTSFAALLKNQHSKWKLANQYEKFPNPREREEYSD